MSENDNHKVITVGELRRMLEGLDDDHYVYLGEEGGIVGNKVKLATTRPALVVMTNLPSEGSPRGVVTLYGRGVLEPTPRSFRRGPCIKCGRDIRREAQDDGYMGGLDTHRCWEGTLDPISREALSADAIRQCQYGGR